MVEAVENGELFRAAQKSTQFRDCARIGHTEKLGARHYRRFRPFGAIHGCFMSFMNRTTKSESAPIVAAAHIYMLWDPRDRSRSAPPTGTAPMPDFSRKQSVCADFCTEHHGNIIQETWERIGTIILASLHVEPVPLDMTCKAS